ncbi:unnamed protein product, partial [Effrenium voratum]
MVEVVQDLLDYVTYAGGVGRRRADAVSGLGAGTGKPGPHDCAFVAEDATGGPRMVPLRDLVFDEVLDKAFDDKEYGLQLLEVSDRGERLVNELARKFNQVNRLVEHDPLWRSRQLPSLLQKVCEGLRRVQLLMSKELQEVWKITFPPIFYPEDDAELSDALPGGWLDLEDLFLAVHLLLRYLSEMMILSGDVVRVVPGARTMTRRQIRDAAPTPELHSLVEAADRTPWLCISVDTKEHSSTEPNESPLKEANLQTPFQALAILNEVLVDHVQSLLSDLHRATYQAFLRVVAAYGRWKKTTKAARETRKSEVQAEERIKKLAMRKVRNMRSTLALEEQVKDDGSADDRSAAVEEDGEPKDAKSPRRRKSIVGQSSHPSQVVPGPAAQERTESSPEPPKVEAPTRRRKSVYGQ